MSGWRVTNDITRLDGRGVFQDGFSKLRDRLSVRFYTSVSAFSADFGAVFSTAIGLPIAADTAEFQAHISSEASAKDSTTEYKEKKKLAKRIIKAVQGSLEDALRKEGELCRKPFEKELRELDLLLENSFLSRRDSLANSIGGELSDLEVDDPTRSVRGGSLGDRLRNTDIDATSNHNSLPMFDKPNGIAVKTPEINDGYPDSVFQPRPPDLGSGTPLQAFIDSVPKPHNDAAHHPTPDDSNATPPMHGVNIQDQEARKTAEVFSVGQESKHVNHVEPPTPPLSSGGDNHLLSNGGVPWYMAPFDPVGTTIEEERWTGRELVRGMSEELSDMDEDELSGLVDVEMTEAISVAADGTLHPESAAAGMSRPKSAAKRRRWRGYR